MNRHSKPDVKFTESVILSQCPAIVVSEEAQQYIPFISQKCRL